MPDLVLDFPLSSCLQTCCNIQYQPLEAITAQVFDKRAGPLYSPLITVLGLFLGGGGCMNRLFTDCYFVYIFSPELTLLGCYSMYSMSALYSVLYFLPSSLLPVFYKQTWNVNRFFFSQAKIYLYGKESTKALLKKKNRWLKLSQTYGAHSYFMCTVSDSLSSVRLIAWEGWGSVWCENTATAALWQLSLKRAVILIRPPALLTPLQPVFESF